MIYLDNAATTKPTESVLKAFNYAQLNFFNPSANYIESTKLSVEINAVRQKILNFLHAQNSYNLIFTSGATEANNTAIWQANKFKNKTILVSLGEHASIFESVKNCGLNYKTINLKQDGTVDENHLIKLLQENDVSMVAIMHVNNETGAINNIPDLSKIVKQHNKSIMFLCDGVQGFCKFKINLENFNVDFYTISAHKVNGLKGIGALIYKNNINLKTFIFGGGQEFNLRSGTENVGGILSFSEAVVDRSENLEYIKNLKNNFIKNIKQLKDIKINAENGSDYILSISCKGVRSEVVVRLMSEKGVNISSGSACHSRHQDNRVLNAMGISGEYLLGTNRISFSNDNTIEEIDRASKIYVDVINSIRGNNE